MLHEEAIVEDDSYFQALDPDSVLIFKTQSGGNSNFCVDKYLTGSSNH